MRKRRHRERLILIAGLVVVALIIVAVILLLVLNRKKLEYLTLTPTFQETELDVNSDYVFMVTTEPEDIKLKDLEYSVDDPTAVFSTASEDNTQAVLHTGAEGMVNIYVKQGDIVSNYLSFSVVDITAQAQAEAELEAQRQAELEAQQMYEAEQAAAPVEEIKYYVQTTSKVRVRSSASTASNDNILSMVESGSKYVKTGDTTDESGAAWVQIDYNGQEGYIRADMVKDISEEEYTGAAPADDAQTQEASNATEQKPQEEKKEEKPQEQAQAPQPSAEDQAAAAAQKAQQDAAAAAAAEQQAQAEAAAAAAAEQQAQMEALAAQQAAAAAAAAAAGTAINCKDGTCYVTADQLNKIHATWDFAGDAIEMAGHHTIGELEAVIGATQH
ncbi:MAG: SH3 domain-containing protein [Lachnospiraceae bacterium]|nr:SH3 domain-containing protein [Lachnospiraceae bacterium]